MANHPRGRCHRSGHPMDKWIAFIAQETEREEIYLVRPNGEGLHQLTKTGHDVFQFEWSPDGKQLAVIFNRNGAFRLESRRSGNRLQSTDLRSGSGIHSNPNWAQDGSFITFEYESPSFRLIYIEWILPADKSHN